MRGPRPAKSKAKMVTPRYYDWEKYRPTERSRPGQGPGETPTPKGSRTFVQRLMQRVPLPRGR